MTNNKIGLLQLSSLTFFLTISSFILYNGNIINISKSDTFSSLIIGSIITIIIFKFILKLRKNFKISNKISKIGVEYS